MTLLKNVGFCRGPSLKYQTWETQKKLKRRRQILKQQNQHSLQHLESKILTDTSH